jgi:hypothetical protein
VPVSTSSASPSWAGTCRPTVLVIDTDPRQGSLQRLGYRRIYRANDRVRHLGAVVIRRQPSDGRRCSRWASTNRMPRDGATRRSTSRCG